MAERIVEVVMCGDVPLTDPFSAREYIIRCKDCAYRRKSWNGKRPDFIPDGFFCAYWGGCELWKPDGYCAWAEPRKVVE